MTMRETGRNPSPGSSEGNYLTGQILIAMPQMLDPRFARSVVYICAHTADGAMGLVINRQIESVTFPDLLQQLKIDVIPPGREIRVMFGGPVETGRGFVLHSADYKQESTLLVSRSVGLTATLEILRDIARGAGPRRSLLALGYAGWGPGQLDNEIQDNGWLTAPADEQIIFGHDLDNKWDRALARLGVSPSALSGDAGHA
ncbi:MAG: YqgE/AlgH family protein [Alphaproteobacteria bacterium]|jgi:putative transcriptional regulator|nr:YqgE/AlgH family protein [Alphaproteobacteria bacterium]